MDDLEPHVQNVLDVLRLKVYFWAQYNDNIKIKSKHGEDYLTLKPVFRVEDLDSDFISIDSFKEKGKDKSYLVTVKLSKDKHKRNITFNFKEDFLIFTFPKVFLVTKILDFKISETDRYTYPTPIYFDPSESSRDVSKFDFFTSVYNFLNFKHYYLGSTNFKEVSLINGFEYQKIKASLHDPYGTLKIPNNCSPYEFIFLLSYHPIYNNHSDTYGFIAISCTDISCFNQSHRFINPKTFNELRIDTKS